MLVETVTDILAFLTILGQISVVASIVFRRVVGRRGILLGFIVALVATSGSLFYSEIAGYEPCVLCWYQRIMMYPLVLLLGLALFRKEHVVAPYALTLSVVGGFISAYHYILQVIPKAPVPCSAVGYSASCTQQFVLQFGYITIPMMALTAFVMISVCMALRIKSS